MSEQNKAHVRRAIEEIWNQHNPDALDEFATPDYVEHDLQAPGGKFVGRAAVKQSIRMYLVAFPDLHFEVEDQLAEGDLVATRWTATRTHRGELLGIQPTGKYATGTGVIISRVQNDKTVENWVHYDMLGLLQQFGVVPSLTSAAARG